MLTNLPYAIINSASDAVKEYSIENSSRTLKIPSTTFLNLPRELDEKYQIPDSHQANKAIKDQVCIHKLYQKFRAIFSDCTEDSLFKILDKVNHSLSSAELDTYYFNFRRSLRD